MTIYKGDFTLSEGDRKFISVLSPKVYKMDRLIEVKGLGPITVNIKINRNQSVEINIKGLNIDIPKKIISKKRTLSDIISVYKISIECKDKDKDGELLLNVKIDENDFKNKKLYFLENLKLLKSKINNDVSEELLNHIEYFDFNYILNIIYGGFIIHEYKLNYSVNPNYNKLKNMFVEKLERVGFIIPNKNPDMLKKLELIVGLMDNSKTISPEDMVYLLINSMPKNNLETTYIIRNEKNLYEGIYGLLTTYPDIDKI